MPTSRNASLILPVDKGDLRALVRHMELPEWVRREVGKRQVRRLLAYALRRMMETGDYSLRCLEPGVLAEIFPSAPNAEQFVRWKFKQGTQLRKLLDAMLQEKLREIQIDESYVAKNLKRVVDGAIESGQYAAARATLADIAKILDTGTSQSEERDYSAFLPSSSSAVDADFEMIDEEEDVDVFAYLPDNSEDTDEEA